LLTRLYFCLILFLTSCGTVPKTDQGPIHPTNTENITQTVSGLTSTTEIYTTSYLQIDERCLVRKSIEDVYKINGTLLIRKMGLDTPQWLYSIDTGITIPIDSFTVSYGFSTDNAQYAFINTKSYLTIIDAKGSILLQKLMDKRYISVLQWINPDKLIIEKKMDNDITVLRTGQVILDLNTNSVIELPYDFPNINPMISREPRWNVFRSTIAVYNPLLTRVVYLAYIDDYGPLVLWDVINKSEIRLLQGNSYDYGGGPQWNNDGSFFYVSIPPIFTSWNGKVYKNEDNSYPYKGGSELYKISDNGDLSRLTYLTAIYNAGEESISLSNNEKYISFWFNKNYIYRDTNPTTELAILDLSTNEIMSLCIKGGDYPFNPIWSPDSNYLAITINYPENNTYTNLLIDLINNAYYEFDQQGYVFGWLKD
jgi:hypothetical protein